MNPTDPTIGRLAKRLGVPRSTLWRRLLRMQAARPEVRFLARDGRVWRVDLEALRAAPGAPAGELVPPPAGDRVEDHEDRLLALERAVVDLSARVKRASKRIPA